MTIIEFLKDLVYRASKLITDEVVVKAKDDKGDLVTNFDYEIENFMCREIKKYYPNFDIISEEFNSKKQLTQNCFVLDPIDGTVNFSHKFPLWGIQIACIKNGATCASMIYLPRLDEMYWADETGCYMNDKKLQVNNYPYDKSLISVEGRNRLQIMASMSKFNRNVRGVYSSCVSFSYVASGVFGGVVLTHDTVWDYIPGQYLVKQAGGFIYNEKSFHIAANSKELGMFILEKAKAINEN